MGRNGTSRLSTIYGSDHRKAAVDAHRPKPIPNAMAIGKSGRDALITEIDGGIAIHRARALIPALVALTPPAKSAMATKYAESRRRRVTTSVSTPQALSWAIVVAINIAVVATVHMIIARTKMLPGLGERKAEPSKNIPRISRSGANPIVMIAAMGVPSNGEERKAMRIVETQRANHMNKEFLSGNKIIKW
ncbi:hypothetical protein D881_03745 [Corynebacterium ulcerans NCTC 12077]|nr:hypothetical protein D881_03745 [Corynebacterium ulcerans NCTC 12077]